MPFDEAGLVILRTEHLPQEGTALYDVQCFLCGGDTSS
jgi:hypothetical protein